jgi:phenylacetate-CoA ligase
MLKIKGTTVFPSMLKTVLDAMPEIAAYVIVARRKDNLSDAVEIKFSSAADPAKIIPALKEEFQGRVKVVPQITAAAPAEIEHLQLPDGARKRRYFVDLRD